MPVIVQAFGFACMAFVFTLLAKPRIRPSPTAYLWALSVDALCILFTFGVMILWPHWWLLCPLLIWGAVAAVHVHRLRDARVMVAVLEANRAPLWAPGRPHPNPYGYPYADWTDDAPEPPQPY